MPHAVAAAILNPGAFVVNVLGPSGLGLSAGLSAGALNAIGAAVNIAVYVGRSATTAPRVPQ